MQFFRARHRGHLDVPPDVTSGRVVVVVGGRLFVGVVEGVLVVGTGDGTGPFGLADDPGCSFATVRAIHAVAPPARAITVVVNRRTRACARSRSIDVLPSRVRLTVIANGVGPASAQGR
jgi:hypothetical protein